MSNVGSDLSSFLFQGTPQASTTATSAPLWLTQALEGAVSAATQLAGQPYQQFPGQTVATPSAQTQQSWQMAGNNGALSAPWLAQAGYDVTSAAHPVTAESIQRFLNPYQGYLTQSLNRNLTENLLPSIQDKFVSAGQSRSPQEAELTSRALRDTQNAVGQSLAGGFQGAVGSLLQNNAQLGALGAQTGALGQVANQIGASNVGLTSAAGQAQDTVAQANINAAMNEFQKQQQWPYQNVGFLSNIINGLPVSAAGTTSTNTTTPATQPGIAQILGLGSQLQGMSGLGFRRGGAVRGALSQGRRMVPHLALAA